MKRLATTVTRHPVRVLVVWLIAVAALLALTSPGSVVDRADVMKSDQTEFLPDRYESVRAAQLEQRGFPTPEGATATIVLRRHDKGSLTAADVASGSALADSLGTIDGVRDSAVDSTGLSPNKKVLLGTVLFERSTFDPLLAKDIEAVRDRTDAGMKDAALVAGYAGEAPTQVDAMEREGITSLLTILIIAGLL